MHNTSSVFAPGKFVVIGTCVVDNTVVGGLVVGTTTKITKQIYLVLNSFTMS